MMKVIPYINTLGTVRYKELLSSPFEFSMLETHFVGWEKNDYHQYVSSSGTSVELYNGTEYIINKVTLPAPETLNDFINDMRRLDEDLFWGDWMEENYEPKDFLPQNEIENYYMELLESIDKGHELTIQKEGENNEKL